MLKNLRAERVRKGLTLDELAQEIGVHPNTLSAWERGKSEPLTSTLFALCEFLDCTPEYLVGMSDNKHYGLVTS